MWTHHTPCEGKLKVAEQKEETTEENPRSYSEIMAAIIEDIEEEKNYDSVEE